MYYLAESSSNIHSEGFNRSSGPPPRYVYWKAFILKIIFLAK